LTDSQGRCPGLYTPWTPGHRGHSVELGLRAFRAVGDRLRGIVISQIETPPLDRPNPGASTLDADKILNQ
jgi:hypothetical protein